MRADTGVGPAMASGSQTNSGSWADLPHGADEEQHGDGRWRWSVASARRLRDDRRVVERAERGEGQEHRDHEAPVTDAVGDEGLLAGRGVGVVGEPERDEEVRAGAHALPAEEGDEQVVAQHQHQHREDEQVQVDEELRELRVAVHVADRVQVDQRADAGDEQAIVIDSGSTRKPTLTWKPADGQPVEQRLSAHGGARRRRRAGRRTRRPSRRTTPPHSGGGEPAGARARRAGGRTTSRTQEAGQRQRGDEPDEVEHRCDAQPFSTEMSSAVAPGRRAEDGHDDAEADDDLGGGHHQHEEHDRPGRRRRRARGRR